MNRALVLSVVVASLCVGRTASAVNLRLQGTVSRVDVTDGNVVVTFTGIGLLAAEDPAVKLRYRPLVLYAVPVHLDLGRGIESYTRVRYLLDLDEQEAIALLKRLAEEQEELEISMTATSIVHATRLGELRVARIKGSSGMIAPWKSLFEESIAERAKRFHVDYDAVKRQLTDPGPPEE